MSRLSLLRHSLIASLLLVALSACNDKTGPAGPAGPTGAQGDPGPAGQVISTGTVSGTVTNAHSSELLAGVTVSGAGSGATTDASGAYTISDVAVGAYTLSFSLGNFTTSTASVNVTAGNTATQNMAMSPVSDVVVNASNVTLTGYGADATLTATVHCYDGRSDCTPTWSWSQSEGPTATAAGSQNTASETYSFGTLADYNQYLFNTVLQDSKMAFFGPSRTDRVKVHGINPYSLEQGTEAKFLVTATMANGDSASTTVTVTGPALPYDVSPGLRNVPVNRVVVLHGPNSYASYAWTFTSVPTTSALTNADISNANTQHPYFTPDVEGTFTLQVTDGTTPVSIDINAGLWQGAISGLGADGKPDAAYCTGCHDGAIAPDKFTEWRQSGHAHILTTQLNTSSHYGSSCFACHTVGYDPSAINGGIDEAADYQDWLNSGIFGVPNADNYATTIANYPLSARLTNVQCENCHGPNGTQHHHTANPVLDQSRISLNSDVCGSCHGEPPRHARFQQWQESGHSNTGLAVWAGAVNPGATHVPTATDPGGGHCGRCHTSQGFRAWITQDVTSTGSGEYINLAGYLVGAGGEVFGTATTAAYQTGLENLGLTTDQIEPQGCVTCHRTHNPGSKSDIDNDVIMRVTANDTVNLPAGFEANQLGLGTLCIACHNSRNGTHNDIVYDWNPTLPATMPTNFMDDELPHHSAQGDVLMGQNAFFVQTGGRGQHSLAKNSCATCHMELTKPPADLSYQLGGTNHKFNASLSICSDCHGVFDGGNVQTTYNNRLGNLNTLLTSAVTRQIKNYINDASYSSVHLVDSSGADLVVMSDPSLLTAITIGGHSQLTLTITYNGVQYNGELGRHDSNSGIDIGLVAYDTSGTPAPAGLMINLPLSSGYFAGQALAKSSWNYTLLADDGSAGVHNPGYTTSIFDATEDALNRLP